VRQTHIYTYTHTHTTPERYRLPHIGRERVRRGRARRVREEPRRGRRAVSPSLRSLAPALFSLPCSAAAAAGWLDLLLPSRSVLLRSFLPLSSNTILHTYYSRATFSLPEEEELVGLRLVWWFFYSTTHLVVNNLYIVSGVHTHTHKTYRRRET
jgi:hypothetical protein